MGLSSRQGMRKHVFSFISFTLLFYIIGLQSLYVNAEEEIEIDETLGKRLSEIPQRIQRISAIAYPDGVPDSILDFYTLPYVNPTTLCGNETQIYRDALKEIKPWAAQMVDSSGKIPSGILWGHFHDTGSYDECLAVAELSPYPVQHCVVQYGNFVRLPKRSFIDWEKTETVIGGIPILKPRLHIGYCLPASCNREEIKSNFRQIVNKYNLTVYMDKYSCTSSNEETPFTTFDVIAVTVVVTPILLAIAATVYDLSFSRKTKITTLRKVVQCFSFYENAKSLFKTSSPKRPLSVLNAIRFLSIFWIIVGHHWLFRTMKPTLNYQIMMQLFSKYYAFVILNTLLAVDNFILLNGLLLSYVFMNVMKKGIKFNLFLFYLHRIIRILPGYTVQILLAMSLYWRYFSSGPEWKTQIYRMKENCFENWWTNILFINNYVHVDKQCIQSTWYLSVDMQLHFLSPIFLFSLYKYKSFIKYGIPICIVLSVLSSFLNAYLGGYPAGSITSSDFTTVYKFPYEYITTHTKLGCWFIGLGLGYILHHNERKKIKLSPLVVRLGWILTFIFGTFVLTAISLFHQENIRYPQLVHSLYTGCSSTIWGFCIAWVILACETGNGRPIHILLSWRVFQPLGKLSFTLYLLHVAVQYGTDAGLKISQYMEIFPNSIVIWGEIAACVFYSTFMSMMYESPFMQLEKKFIHSRASGKQIIEIGEELSNTKNNVKPILKSNGETSTVAKNGNSNNDTSLAVEHQIP